MVANLNHRRGLLFKRWLDWELNEESCSMRPGLLCHSIRANFQAYNKVGAESFLMSLYSL